MKQAVSDLLSTIIGNTHSERPKLQAHSVVICASGAQHSMKV